MKKLNLMFVTSVGVISISIISMSMRKSTFPIILKKSYSLLDNASVVAHKFSVTEEMRSLGLKIEDRDSTIIDNNKNTVKMYGLAKISNKKIVVKADVIELDLNSKTGLALGNVNLYDINKNTTSNSTKVSFIL